MGELFQVYVGPRFAGQMGRKNGDLVAVRFGNRSTVARLLIRQDKKEGLIISPEMARRLLLPAFRPFSYRMANPECIHIGPLIGIFTASVLEGEGPKSEILSALIQVFAPCKGQVFIFCPEGVNPAQGTIRGWYQTGEGRWQQRIFPLPDVVYDRVETRSAEKIPEVVTVKQYLAAKLAGRIITPRFFDKWDMHRLLSTKGELAGLLPETRLYSRKSLTEMMKRFDFLFVKPRGGSQGKNIIELIQSAGKWQAYKKNTLLWQGMPDETLLRVLQKEGVNRGYIVQQGLYLADMNGRPFDVRSLMQKNGRDRFLRTKLFARVAPAGQRITNISTGGVGEDLMNVLNRIFPPEQAKDIRRQIETLSLDIATGLQKELAEGTAELGIDFGIDREGRVWLIEVNSKPGKNTEESKITEERNRKALLRPLLFARYWAGFDSPGMGGVRIGHPR